MVKLLDVTLRDGGYTNSFDFQEDEAINIVKSLHESGVDYIEIGYRNGPEKGSSKLGISARVDHNYIQAIRSNVPDAKLAVMLHPHNVSKEDLTELKDKGISIIRVCVRADKILESLKTIAQAKKLGLYVSANFVRITYFERSEARDCMLAAQSEGADLVYFADSNGHMVPSQVREYTEFLKGFLDIPLGFHAHNNLSLALSNALVAIDSGIDIIDSSICGMGRGAGNLSTETFIAYLERSNVKHKYSLSNILNIAEYVEQNLLKNKSYASTRDLTFGMANFSSDFTMPILEESLKQDVGWEKIVLDLYKSHPQKPNLKDIQNIASKIKSSQSFLM